MAEMDVLLREQVLANREISPGVFLLTISRNRGFRPGQVVAVTVEPAIPSRLYSIASGTGDEAMDLLFDVVPEGALSPHLARLQPGDTLYVSPPFGTFVDSERKSVWIATGTGIAPFRSMARSGMVREKTLAHGSRLASGLFFRNYFREALGRAYVPCCSRDEDEGVFTGRVTQWLETASPAADAAYMLCGSTEMVVDVRDDLVERGVPYANVAAEIYF